MTTGRGLTLAAAALAAAFLFLLLPLPPSRQSLPASPTPAHTAVGSFHVHTDRSDGSGSPDVVAAAAARAGLDFIIVTDHGDGTREPDRPRYRSGVLVIDAVELSTQDGHYIAIGLPRSPYPLRGEARDVVEDVRRLGGFGVVAHPDSAKASLTWHDWTVRFDAMEWLNADTEWRNESALHLARALVRYPFRPAETLATLLDRPDDTLARWDALARLRPVVALAGADAHARLGVEDDEGSGYQQDWFVRIPSYLASFRTFSTVVTVTRPLAGDPASDAEQIVSALKAGRVYTAIDALAAPPTFEFMLDSSEHKAEMGSVASGAGTLVARIHASAAGFIVLRRDGHIVAQQPLPELRFDPRGEAGAYRAEVHLSRSFGDPPVPWLVSNPIYLQRSPDWGAPLQAAFPEATTTYRVQGGPWHTEKSDDSIATASQKDPPAGDVEFGYRLAGGGRTGQYAALGISVGNALSNQSRFAFRAYASQPMRVSVQARDPTSGNRWQRSIYLDRQPRDIIIPFADMRPMGTSGAFDPARADTVLFVVDTTHALPNSSGTITLSDLRVER